MAGMMPPQGPGQNVVPFAPPQGLQAPPMMPNPAFAQWQQMAQAWQQEQQQRSQQFLSACQYISQDAHKRYRIDIEADSTIAPDQEAEKAARTQFLQAITPFMESVLPQAIANPPLAPLIKQLILFAVRGFSVSRQLENEFESALDAMMQSPPPPQQQQGGRNTKSPMEIQAETAVAQGKQQVDQQKNAVDMMKLFAEQQIEREKLAAETGFKGAQLNLQQREASLKEGLANARMQHLSVSDERGLI